MCMFCNPDNPCPDCLDQMIRSQPRLQETTPAKERFFVVSDPTDPGSEVSSFEEACQELQTLRVLGFEDPRIIFLN